jgi:hypothetical protein
MVGRAYDSYTEQGTRPKSGRATARKVPPLSGRAPSADWRDAKPASGGTFFVKVPPLLIW